MERGYVVETIRQLSEVLTLTDAIALLRMAWSKADSKIINNFWKYGIPSDVFYNFTGALILESLLYCQDTSVTETME